MRRTSRILAAAAALALLAAAASTAPATAATGVGSAVASTTILGVDLGGGNVLSVKVIGDEGQATIDPAVSAPSAFSRLSILKLNSTLVPALNAVDDNLPTVESRTPGGSPSVETAALNLSTPAVGDLGAGSIASGSITPAKLTSSLTGGVANSALVAEIADLSLVGGLLGVNAARSDLGAVGSPSAATANRSVSVDSITVLDLGALLEGLGIPLSNLPVDTVVALVEGLGLPVSISGLPDGSTLADYVGGLRQTIDAINAQGNLSATVDSILGQLNTLLAPTGVAAPSAGTTLQSALDATEALLDGVLATSIAELDKAALVAADGVKVGVEAKATDTLQGSAANITGEVGKVRVGGLELPGLNLLAAADAISAQVQAINSQVSSALALVDPGLANLVNVSVLDRSATVTSSGGYNRVRAGITGISATVTPPADLADIVNTVTTTTDPISGVVDTAGLSATMGQLTTLLNTGATALSQPSTIRAAEVLAAADFAPGATSTTTPAPAPELPRTGGLPLAILGAVSMAAAMVTRRWMK